MERKRLVEKTLPDPDRSVERRYFSKQTKKNKKNNDKQYLYVII